MQSSLAALLRGALNLLHIDTCCEKYEVDIPDEAAVLELLLACGYNKQEAERLVGAPAPACCWAAETGAQCKLWNNPYKNISFQSKIFMRDILKWVRYRQYDR
jgi:hypothetical protein